MAYNNKNKTVTNFYSNTYDCGETKYYVNGAYIDLCGLPIEEYMKPQCCCGGNNDNDDDDETVKQLNEIYVRSFKNDNGEIFYQAVSTFAVTSNIKVNIYSMNNALTVLDLYIGDTQTNTKTGDTEEFLTITLSIQEDDMYKYVVVTDSSKIMYDVYYHTMLLSKSDTIPVSEFMKINIENDTTEELTFVIPSTDINCNDMEEDELNAFCEENQHCLVIYIPKTIYENKAYSISNIGGDIVTEKFAYQKDITINNEKYAYLKDKATDDIAPYVPLYEEDIIYNYKLTIDK